MKLWSLALSLILALGAVDVEAKRLGGGKSVGKQSSNVTQREAAPAAPGAPAQNAAAAKPAAPAAAPAAAPKKPWGAMLGGLAAGLGLAWLASSLGLGEAFGQFILIALVVLLAMMAFGWFMRSRRAGAADRSPYAFQGAGAGEVPTAKPAYRPENVGNDASARPWERSQTAFDGSGGTSGIVIGSGLASSWSVPAGFDADGFLKAAKSNFILLQAAWDQADMGTLRSMMTDDMLTEISAQLAEREAHTGGAVNLTEVQMLQAQLLGIEELGDGYMASVEFSGMIRETPQAGPSPFREVWNMVKPRDGSRGWLVAGVQALQ
ncbi:Tim44 domain-containing protein [Curvibacter sp. PAE-UM]|uniref:Tim44 domain-containing protein n=1 Tax=Curvibacter sp. PAE-UM TaxID=1714344 RepID=UPI00070FEFDD|nr:Tim44-like domain-containing protein [Curvibacter sp. PAE-UM]KRH99173.1 preprotein translocase subunit Tim44 [Curvibacter sp. PAE-UM]